VRTGTAKKDDSASLLSRLSPPLCRRRTRPKGVIHPPCGPPNGVWAPPYSDAKGPPQGDGIGCSPAFTCRADLCSRK